MVEFSIDKKYNNKKIHTVLLDTFNGLTSSLVFKALKQKDIKVNNKRINDNINVFTGDIISVYISDSYLYKTVNFDIVYEDENIIILNKPKDIEVINNSHNCITYLLQQKYTNLESEFPYPWHRLDRNTSGLIIFAKNQTSLEILNSKFSAKEIKKIYKCTVIGILDKKEAVLEDYLFKDSKKAIVYISSSPKKGYQKIITSYKVLHEDLNNNLSTLEVELHTGKTHQIRAHLAFIGHPILGDGKYGNNTINKKFKKKTQELCAYKICFNFKTDSGILNYLKNKSFEIKRS